MLFNTKGEQVHAVPDTDGVGQHRGAISDQEYGEIVARLNRAIEERDSFKAMWLQACLPEPLRQKLGGEGASSFFGQLVWETVRQRPEEWTFYRPEQETGQLEGVYYFRDKPR